MNPPPPHLCCIFKIASQRICNFRRITGLFVHPATKIPQFPFTNLPRPIREKDLHHSAIAIARWRALTIAVRIPRVGRRGAGIRANNPSVIGSSNANDILEVSLVKPSPTGLRSVVAPFHPKFTYAIFGDDERIFGYQELKISLRYHVSDMRPNLQVSYSKKFRSIGETEPTDIPAALADFIPEGETEAEAF